MGGTIEYLNILLLFHDDKKCSCITMMGGCLLLLQYSFLCALSMLLMLMLLLLLLLSFSVEISGNFSSCFLRKGMSSNGHDVTGYYCVTFTIPSCISTRSSSAAFL